MVEKLKYYVNGEWKVSATEKYMPVTDSSTGAVIAEAPCCTKAEVEEAIAAAQAAFPAWADMPITKRVQVLYKYRELVVAHTEELALLVAKEQGKALREARGEIGNVVGDTEFACGAPWLSQGEFSQDVSARHDLYRIREPLGVFAGIAPSNFPAMIPFGWMIPLCIVLGNTFVLKAASAVPLTAVRLLELLEKAGVPKGVVNMVTCSRVEAEIVMTDPRVKGISYVGSSKVGKHIYATSAANGKRVQVLGAAKNHAVVLKDVNLEVVASRIVASSFGAAGQRCMALPVVCVENEIADELVKLVAEKAAALKVGPAYKDCTRLGPVTTADLRDNIVAAIDQGVADGATLVLDGRNPSVEAGFEDGNFVGATVFDNVTPGMPVGEEEIFGPVLAFKRINSFEEGLAIANSNPLANGAVLFSNDGYYARRFIKESHAGSVGINVGIPAVAPGFPFSGHKDSFFGDLHAKGRDGIAFYTESKCVTQNWIGDEDLEALGVEKTVISCSGS